MSSMQRLVSALAAGGRITLAGLAILAIAVTLVRFGVGIPLRLAHTGSEVFSEIGRDFQLIASEMTRDHPNVFHLSYWVFNVALLLVFVLFCVCGAAFAIGIAIATGISLLPKRRSH